MEPRTTDIHQLFADLRGMPDVAEETLPAPSAEALAWMPYHPDLTLWRKALRDADMSIPWVAEDLYLFSHPTSLQAAQIGYAMDADGRPLEGWPDDWIVLGHALGDPIIGRLALAHIEVMFARHGAGSWQPQVLAARMEDLAAALHAWGDLFLRQHGQDVYDDTYALRPGFVQALQARIREVLPQEQADVFMQMVEG
ncbi:hypothetical protein [Bordetella genomosp. 13]|uniref:hypothetical protein n=1 Tax=Bordetella genomosp. 13 TaxID=463040 RepID=UPI0011A3F055|nr:hypothetical protein [Bordetella genomosp. 13]